MKKNFKACTQVLQKNWVFIAIMAVILVTYRLNAYADILLIGMLSLLLLINVKNNKLFYSYFALIFFEPIMVVPIVGGTFFRLFYLLLALRVLIDFIGKKWVKMDIPTIIVGAVFFFTSFIYSVSLSRNISVAMNVLCVLYISLSLKSQDDFKEKIGELLTFIAVFSALSGMFGVVRGFIFGGIEATRFYGTIDDPNYSALFYIIGFFASFGASLIKNKWVKIALAVLLGIFILATASITALLVVGLLAFMWFIVNFGVKRSLLLVLVGIILIMCIMFIPFKEGSYVDVTQNKLNRFLEFEDPNSYLSYQYPNYTDFEMYLNRVTSNRYYLAKTYAIHLFVNTPITEQLFGGNNPIEGDFRDTVPLLHGKVSHNSYIDMMFMMGYVCLFLVLFFIGWNIIRYFIKYLKTKEPEYVCLILIMLSVLFFSTAISIFPYRYFIAFLIL